MRLWYLSHIQPWKEGSGKTATHTVAPEHSLIAHFMKGLTKNRTSSLTELLCMHVWSLNLQRNKSAKNLVHRLFFIECIMQKLEKNELWTKI